MNNNQSNNLYIILITLVATLGGFLFGFDSGVINGTVRGLEVAFNAEDIGSGFNVASMLLGCAVGAFFAGRLADKYGRRSMLRVAASLFIVSAFGSGIASSSPEFIIYRILGGLAVGAASVMAPAYISEIAPARYRGALATLQQIAIISGLFISYLSNYLLAEESGSAENTFWLGFDTWRWMFWMEIIPSTVFLISLFFIPQTPRFLVSRQKKEEAIDVLSKLFGHAQAKQKMKEIDASLAADHHRPKLSDLYDNTIGRLRPIVWAGLGLAVFQQLVGINVIFYYGAVLWQAVGFGERDALLINVVSGGLSVASVVVSLLLVDKVGRKPLLIIGSAGMSVTLSLMVVAFGNGELLENGSLALSDQMGVLALISANTFLIFFNLSWGPVMWVMLGEMFPNQLRGSGLAVTGLAQWISNFTITLTFPLLLASIGLAITYSIYAISAVISIAFVYRYVHETKGRELEEMKG
ncbi:MAG TPA: sugar porter family MFS transporter [Cyclobacteriaceae bacterium]